MAKKELKIKETNKYATLEQAITEGGNALIPFEFDYPNTDLTVEIKLKPVNNKEVNSALQEQKLEDTTFEIELLKASMFNPDETPIDKDIIANLPAGVVSIIAEKIADISGIKTDKEQQDRVMKEVMGF